MEISSMQRRAFDDCFGEDYFTQDQFENSYCGEFDTLSDMQEYMIEYWIDVMGVPDSLVPYIDEDYVIRELQITDYIYSDYQVGRHYERKYFLFLRNA